MMRTIKRVLLSALSILGISFLIWVLFLLNPSFSYAHQTQVDQVTIYHNQPLEVGTELVIRNAIDIIKKSKLYDEELNIQLCMNDDKSYPEMHPTPGGVAYAFLNKTVIYASKPNFKENVAEFKWAVNNYELRKFDLTYLLAHEFTHNLQCNESFVDFAVKTFGNINWKFEGHADYIARQYQNDGLLKSKIARYLAEESKDHQGLPVFELKNGTKQILSYYKYALVVQYLLEVKGLTYGQIIRLDPSIAKPYAEMLEWSRK